MWNNCLYIFYGLQAKQNIMLLITFVRSTFYAQI